MRKRNDQLVELLNKLQIMFRYSITTTPMPTVFIGFFRFTIRKYQFPGLWSRIGIFYLYVFASLSTFRPYYALIRFIIVKFWHNYGQFMAPKNYLKCIFVNIPTILVFYFSSF